MRAKYTLHIHPEHKAIVECSSKKNTNHEEIEILHWNPSNGELQSADSVVCPVTKLKWIAEPITETSTTTPTSYGDRQLLDSLHVSESDTYLSGTNMLGYFIYAYPIPFFLL